jgi:hypothetical protein
MGSEFNGSGISTAVGLNSGQFNHRWNPDEIQIQ